MAAPSYVGQGGAVATSTMAAPSYPASIAAGDALLLCVSTNGSAMGAAPAGWTQVDTTQVGGGIRKAVFYKIAAGGESGSVTVTGLTGGTKGEAEIIRISPSTPGNLITVTGTGWTDTDTGSTAFGGTGSSWTSDPDCLIVSTVTALAPTGSYSANATGPDIAQAGATVNTTARFAGRTGSNTIYYALQTASVSSGGTGAPSFSATTVGANGAGAGMLVLLREGSSAVDVTLTGDVAAMTLDAPAGTVTTTSNVTLTGPPATVTVSAVTGTATLTSNIDDTGDIATITLAAPAGTVTATSVVDVSLTGQPAAVTLAAPAGSASTVSVVDVSLTGAPTGITMGAPAGTVAAGSAADNVTLTGAVATVTTAAPAGTVSTTSVGDVALTGDPAVLTIGAPAGTVTASSASGDVTLTGPSVTVTLSAPTGTLDVTSVGNVSLTASNVATLTTAAPVGAVEATTNVTLVGEVAVLELAALAGQLATSTLVSLVGQAATLTVGAPTGTLRITSVGDGVAVQAPALTLIGGLSGLALTSGTGNLTLQPTRADMELTR